MSELTDDLRKVLLRNKVPYKVIAAFHAYDTSTIGEFVEMYDDREDLRRKGPQDLNYAPRDPATPTPEEENTFVRPTLAST